MTQTTEPLTLFEGITDGYHSYRIPALLVAANGDLLAFCEGRRDSISDQGQIDLLMKRSNDGGLTWSGQSVVATEPEMTCGNPCPVVDRDTGRILMPFCKNRADGREGLIVKGKAPRTVWVTRSDDHGVSWSEPEEITDQVKKTCWTWYATGPGHALQLVSGRLIIPCDHKISVDIPHTDEAFTRGVGSHLIYSDDHGATWRIGAVLSLPGNECCALECDDGSLYLNCRTRSQYGVRSFGRSRDGGLSFIEEGFHPELVEPRLHKGGCQGSMLKLQADKGENSLYLFCNPATAEEKRRRLALHVSEDQCRTWREAMVVNEGPAGYSDLALLPGGRIACLHEAGDEFYSERLLLRIFSREQLLEAENMTP